MVEFSMWKATGSGGIVNSLVLRSRSALCGHWILSAYSNIVELKRVPLALGTDKIRDSAPLNGVEETWKTSLRRTGRKAR